jgi:REP element-mobilizing transposase RayT
LFYHLVWATKNRQPILTSEIEPEIHELLRSKAFGLGATVFALNGMEDHVHMVVAIPPKIAVAAFVGQVKGVASARFNQSRPPAAPPFFWQEEYGAFSFDRKRLSNYVAYVQRQKEHHALQSTLAVLERTSADGMSMIRETQAVYDAEGDGWRHDFVSEE